MRNGRVRQQLADAYQQFRELGGVQALRSGEWLLMLVQRSLTESQTKWREEVRQRSNGRNIEADVRRLTHAAARKAALAGAVAAGAVSVDEVVAFLTAGEGGIGLPANLAFAVGSICAEMFYLTRLQVQLVAQIGALHGESDADTTDVLAALAIAFSGGDPAFLANMPAASMQARAEVQTRLNSRLKSITRKLGMKLFRRSVVKAAVPIGAIAMSATSNYRSTMAVSHAARQYFTQQRRVLQVS